jgi:hypothetical protein
MRKFAQGRFELKHPEKYIGKRTPLYRSSWEWAFMQFCDNNPAIENWASEAVKIPYRDPLTGKQSVYVPDFLIQYVDKNGRKHAEVIEVKPMNQTVKELVGNNKINQAHFVRNMAKWEAAKAWCQQQNIHFRIISENDIFHQGKR